MRQQRHRWLADVAIDYVDLVAYSYSDLLLDHMGR